MGKNYAGVGYLTGRRLSFNTIIAIGYGIRMV
jgi:hypothetical protein